MYYEKEKADHWLQKAADRGEELGLQVVRPLPFAAASAHFEYGARVPCAPPPCHNPWNTCFLSVDEEGRRQMIFCCSAFHYGVKYDKGDLAEENFRKVWNHPAAQAFPPHGEQEGRQSDLRLLPVGRPLRPGEQPQVRMRS